MRSFIALILLFGAGAVSAQGVIAPVKSFRDQFVLSSPESLLAPTVLEVPITGMLRPPMQVMVTDAVTGELIASRYRLETENRSTPFKISYNNNLYYPLFDNNYSTDSDFYLVNDMETVTTLLLVSDTPITSSALDLRLASNVAYPNSIKISAVNEQGKRYVVVSNQRMTDQRISFLQTVSKEWVVEITHSQPLRLVEVDLIEDVVEKSRTESVRFLARPGSVYNVYLNPDTKVSIPSVEVPDLASNEGVVKVLPGHVTANPNFIEADNDLDGVVDRLDNCVNISNSNQIDVNQNGRGDACDDWDQDGILNSRDNCSDHPNRSQTDEDGDGVGDVCDSEESRFTERHAWVPWVGLGVAATTIFGMFLLVRRKEEQIEESV